LNKSIATCAFVATPTAATTHETNRPGQNSRSGSSSVAESFCQFATVVFTLFWHGPQLSLVLFQFLFSLDVGPRPGKVNELANANQRVYKPFRVAREIGLPVDADLGLISIFG